MSIYRDRSRQSLTHRGRRLGHVNMWALGIIVLGACAGVAGLLHPWEPKATPGAANEQSQQAAAEVINPLRGRQLFADPSSNASMQAAAWRTTRPDDAAKMDVLAARPAAKWLTSPQALDAGLDTYLAQAAKQQALPVLVAYYIPDRDCGLYSAGGAKSADAYREFIAAIATKIGGNRAVVILEPDALASLDAEGDDGKACLTKQQRTTRLALLSEAVNSLKALPATSVYIDAGHSAWVTDTGDMAERLRQAGVSKADGFSLNVSNFQTTEANTTYGAEISQAVGGKHFVIDTSRNGRGAFVNKIYPEQGWCNPPGRGLGKTPTTDTGNALIDAFMYIKSPGESDGTDPDPDKCFGGPRAGAWWPEYALGLLDRRVLQ